MKSLLSQDPCMESDTGPKTENTMMAVYRERIVKRINDIYDVDLLEFINNMLDAFKEKWGI